MGSRPGLKAPFCRLPSVPGTLVLCVGFIVHNWFSAANTALSTGAPPNVSDGAALFGCAVDAQDGDEAEEDYKEEVDEDEEASGYRSIVRWLVRSSPSLVSPFPPPTTLPLVPLPPANMLCLLPAQPLP